jgi:dTMP kinase
MFITFEGPEGSGKSSIIKKLTQFLQEQGMQENKDYIVTKEPGSNLDPVSLELRNLILSPEKKVNPEAEIFLYLADRCQHVNNVIVPALSDGKMVICDRHIHSTIAYQGYGRRFGDEKKLKKIIEMNDFSTKELKSLKRSSYPDHVFLFDVDVEVGLSRATKTEFGNKDRLESESLHFHERVRFGYLRNKNKYCGEMTVIDTTHLNLEQTFSNFISVFKERVFSKWKTK